ncbi:MAG: serine/threonine protein phosphatase [Treponema sp.]|nr:serine/threonine protein phosphatase [Treponema sp.]
MIQTGFLGDILSGRLKPDAVLDLSAGGRAVILSDLHMGAGLRDDLAHQGELVTALLRDYYLERGWILVLNGDIEELHRHPLHRIRERWGELYRVFALFAEAGRLYKLVGNHDDALLHRKSYPFKLHQMIRIETGTIPAYVYHGHQPSIVYSNFNKLMGIGIRYVLRPFGIGNISWRRNPYHRYAVEKAAYDFSLEQNCISIIGHTHRPLFESLGRFEYIRFEIESLCRRFPLSSGEERERIRSEVEFLRVELGKLSRSERRSVLRQSLYGQELPVPCLFNSGCAIGRKGLNAIEISAEDIALTYWFERGKGKRFVGRGEYRTEEIADGRYLRAVLNRERLDSILARISLLGGKDSGWATGGTNGAG